MVDRNNTLKKILFFFLLALITDIKAQEIKVIDNKGTINSVKNNRVTTSTTAPTTPIPLENDVWFDTSTTPSTVRIYNGTTWLIANANIYTSDGMLTGDRTVSVGTNDLTLLSSDDNKSSLTLRKGANSHEVGIAFRNSGNNYNAAIVMGSGASGDLDFYSGGNDSDIDNLIKTLSLHDNNQIEFSQYGSGTFENVNPDYILGVLNNGNVVELELDDVDNQDASEVNLSTPIDIDGDTTNETTVQQAIEKISELTFNGTTGSVFFADTDGTPTEDNDDLFWDNTNDRLYVGNSSLTGTNALNVGGTTRTSGLNNSNGSNNLPSYRFTSDSDTGMYRSNTNELSFTTGGNDAITIASDQNVTLHNLDAGNITDEVVVADSNGVLKKAPINTLIPLNAIERTNAPKILTESDYAIIITAPSHSITLPTISLTDNYIGREYIIKNITNSDISISAYKDATDTDLLTIPSNNTLKLQSDGTSWNQMNNYNLLITTNVSNQLADYTITATDDGSIITFPGDANYTLTIPTGLPIGFNISIYQKDDGITNNGNVTIVADSGVTIINRLDRFITAGDGAATGIVALENNVFYISGDLKRN